MLVVVVVIVVILVVVVVVVIVVVVVVVVIVIVVVVVVVVTVIARMVTGAGGEIGDRPTPSTLLPLHPHLSYPAQVTPRPPPLPAYLGGGGDRRQIKSNNIIFSYINPNYNPSL